MIKIKVKKDYSFIPAMHSRGVQITRDGRLGCTANINQAPQNNAVGEEVETAVCTDWVCALWCQVSGSCSECVGCCFPGLLGPDFLTSVPGPFLDSVQGPTRFERGKEMHVSFHEPQTCLVYSSTVS